MPYDKEKILNLSTEEKYELATRLWDNLGETFLKKIIADEDFAADLKKRIDKIDHNPNTLIPWEEVHGKMKFRF